MTELPATGDTVRLRETTMILGRHIVVSTNGVKYFKVHYCIKLKREFRSKLLTQRYFETYKWSFCRMVLVEKVLNINKQ